MKKALCYALLGLILSAFSFTQTAAAFGRDPRAGHSSGGQLRDRPVHYEPYEHRPFHYYPSLPPGHISLRVADMLYYYAGGVYYQYTPSGYVTVSAPMGAMIPALPPYHKQILYDGRTYFFYNNAYYVQEPAGYSVVTPPSQVVTSNPPAVEAPEKTVVVTVPNPNGSYIPVTLEKYSDGYKGPNGEFYPDYPTIDQLKAMYSKASSEAERPLPEQIVVDVPNKNGSVTKVTLNRNKDGYVGPEGEYYKEKPTLEQLKAMYGK